MVRTLFILGSIVTLLGACGGSAGAPQSQPERVLSGQSTRQPEATATPPVAMTPEPTLRAGPTDTPQPTSAQLSDSFLLPTENGAWVPPAGAYESDPPTGTGTLTIEGIGVFSFDTQAVRSTRPDIFQPGHFSVFDTLVRVAAGGQITLEYHFDESRDTHVIDALNGEPSFWYQAYYAGGWPENNAFRMDMFPYKDGARIHLRKVAPEHLAAIHQTFEEEVERLARNSGQVIVPEVNIRTPAGDYPFQDVLVTPHNVRSDVFQPGVITALDALLSLGEQGHIPQLKLTWYENIGTADPVQHYFVEKIGEAGAFGGCGFVYETGPRQFSGFTGSHIHIPSDLRAIVSPEYALWYWICLGGF